MKRILYTLFIYVACVSCITEDYPVSSSPTATFEALWRTLDEHYCFFDYKELNWESVHQEYAAQVSDTMSREALFDVLSRMTYTLRDGHVNLISSMNVSRYGAWYDDYPMNYSDSLLHQTLGRAEDYRQAGIMQYRILLPDSVGYVRVESLSAVPSIQSLGDMLIHLSPCQALILDLRSNGGGMLTAAERIASSFVKERTLVGYMQHKRGPGHSDFSPAEPIYLDPSSGVRWLRPVVILTNRRTYSAANALVVYLQPQSHVIVVGDRTGGGSGLPFTTTLPNGWGIRFSASPMLTTAMEHTEFGIEPDVHCDISTADYSRSVDTILECARDLIREALEAAKKEKMNVRGDKSEDLEPFAWPLRKK